MQGTKHDYLYYKDAVAVGLAAGLTRLGFNTEARGFSNRSVWNRWLIHQHIDGVYFRVRSGNREGIPQVLVFSVNPHGLFRSEAEMRINCRLDGDWPAKVKAWIEAQVPLAKARMANNARIRQAEVELQSAVFAMQDDIAKWLTGARWPVPEIRVRTDGVKICAAEVVLSVPGATADELAGRIETLIRAISLMKKH